MAPASNSYRFAHPLHPLPTLHFFLLTCAYQSFVIENIENARTVPVRAFPPALQTLRVEIGAHSSTHPRRLQHTMAKHSDTEEEESEEEFEEESEEEESEDEDEEEEEEEEDARRALDDHAVIFL